MTSYRTGTYTVSSMEKSKTILLLSQPSVSGAAVSLLVSGLTVDILSIFCHGFIVQFVRLMLNKFLNLGVVQFHCFVYRQNVTCLKRFTRYGHYAGDVEDISLIIGKLTIIAVPKIRVFGCGLVTLCKN